MVNTSNFAHVSGSHVAAVSNNYRTANTILPWRNTFHLQNEPFVLLFFRRFIYVIIICIFIHHLALKEPHPDWTGFRAISRECSLGNSYPFDLFPHWTSGKFPRQINRFSDFCLQWNRESFHYHFGIRHNIELSLTPNHCRINFLDACTESKISDWSRRLRWYGFTMINPILRI